MEVIVKERMPNICEFQSDGVQLQLYIRAVMAKYSQFVENQTKP
jgi:hypothetical protein